MDLHASMRHHAQAFAQRCEEAFDVPFGGDGNPLRHLGAMGLYLFWIVIGTGLYMYVVLDIGIDQVYRSINYLSIDQWYLGGILRSLHRYATDAFMLVMLLHLLREWAYPLLPLPFLFVDHRRALIWLAFVSAIGGY